MLLPIECIILCFLFTIFILPAQYRNPLSQFASYPPAIKRRVYELPEYKEFIGTLEHKNWVRKMAGALLSCILFAFIAYFSGKRTFTAVFYHVFILFLSVDLYDLVVLDLIIFCHSTKLMIPGTEDMVKEYKNPGHHIKGAAIGAGLGAIVALLSACIIRAVSLFL